jgi:folate-binding protein YgfZ
VKTLDFREVFVMTHDDLPPEQADAVLDAAVASRTETACVELRGTGAVACIQGLTTNDVQNAGDGSFLYSAFLTPKGMIISDVWISRFDDAVTLFLPREAAPEVLDLLHRSVPPRLATVEDVSSNHVVYRLAGPMALEYTSRAGFAVPEPGRTLSCKIGPSEYVVSRPGGGPFALQIKAMEIDVHDVNLSLDEGGVLLARKEALETARVIAGWPRLGAEIDQKTLPQEVGFDRMNGLSYTKGCYTGQEVVARLHFRGHANKEVVGLSWEDDPDSRNPTVSQGDAEVGRVTSMIWLDPIDQYIGLAMVKRTVDTAEPLLAAGSDATIVELPFRFDS